MQYERGAIVTTPSSSYWQCFVHTNMPTVRVVGALMPSVTSRLFPNDQGPVANSCQNSLYFYPGPTLQLPPNLWHRLSTWLAEQGPPSRCAAGPLREGSRLYSYLLRGNITALKPHNLLPHPAVSTFWRRPSRSPPTLATGHQSQRAQLAQGRWGSRDSGSARKARTHQMDQGGLQGLNPSPQGQWPTLASCRLCPWGTQAC